MQCPKNVQNFEQMYFILFYIHQKLPEASSSQSFITICTRGFAVPQRRNKNKWSKKGMVGLFKVHHRDEW